MKDQRVCQYIELSHPVELLSYAKSFAAKSLFINTPDPAAVHTIVDVFFILTTPKKILCRVSGRVAISAPYAPHQHQQGGMCLILSELDSQAQAIVTQNLPSSESQPQPTPTVASHWQLSNHDFAPLLSISQPIIGIDLGSQHVYLAYQGKIIGHSETKITLDAFHQAHGFLRFLGHNFNAIATQHLCKILDFPTDGSDSSGQGLAAVLSSKNTVSFVSLLTQVFEKIRNLAETALGEAIAFAIVTVPVHFDQYASNRVLEAAAAARLIVVRLVNKAIAATTTIPESHNNLNQSQTLAVVHIGQDATEISVVSVQQKRFKILASTCDLFCGGNDIDARLLRFIVALSRPQLSLDCGDLSLEEYQSLQQKAIAVKLTLSQEKSCTLLLAPQQEITIYREDLIALVQDILTRIEHLLKKCLDDAGQPTLNQCIVLGGSCHSQWLQEFLTQTLKRPINTTIHPEHAPVLGAMHLGAQLQKRPKTSSTHHQLPESLRLGTKNGNTLVLIPALTRLPTYQSFLIAMTRDIDFGQLMLYFVYGEHSSLAENKTVGNLSLPPTDINVSATAMHRRVIRLTLFITSENILTLAAGDQNADLTESFLLSTVLPL